ncbi:MAG: hypothetical protein JST80_11585 [Bdellovibrionales bacterium]|nr:hypothetical protein [Bdellovibrionales bacterium]
MKKYISQLLFRSFLIQAVLIAFQLHAPLAQAYFGAPGTQVPVLKSQAQGSPYGYYEYLPQNYQNSGSTKCPVVIFAHGVGEGGDRGATTSSLSKVLANGPPKKLKNGWQTQACVFSPQSDTYGWFDVNEMNNFVDYIFQNYNVDTQRLYVTGLSAGGALTWNYGRAHPERVAAIVPVCGATDSDSTNPVLLGRGVWAFHNFGDGTVGYQFSAHNINGITPTSADVMTGYPYTNGGSAASMDMISIYSISSDSYQWVQGNTTNTPNNHDTIRFTLYKTGGHDAWSAAYDNADMWNWLYTWVNTGASTPTPTPVPTVAPTATPPGSGNWGTVPQVNISGNISVSSSNPASIANKWIQVSGWSGVDGSNFTAQWSVLSGPGVTIASPNSGGTVIGGFKCGITVLKAVLTGAHGGAEAQLTINITGCQ